MAESPRAFVPHQEGKGRTAQQLHTPGCEELNIRNLDLAKNKHIQARKQVDTKEHSPAAWE